MRFVHLVAAIVVSIALMAASLWHQVQIAPSEALGFVTGAWCVWLTVRQHLWNWPIGIASSLFYAVLFLQTRLFADMSLQVVYVILGVLGWYWWLHGGQDRGRLSVTRIAPKTAAALALLVVAGTIGMTYYLYSVHDSAPFLDALTTSLSLAAQYQLTKKYLENWYVWITTDVIYIGLYFYKHLFLTSGLYGLFIVLCLLGLKEWRRSQNQELTAGQGMAFENDGFRTAPIQRLVADEPLEVPHG